VSGRERDITGSKSDIEKEEGVIRRWTARGKGKPIRWKMIRDLMACLSLAWLDSFQTQMAMRRLWGLKPKTTRDLLEELELEGSVVQEKHPKGGFRWGATPDGLAFWVVKTQAIPASVALVASTSAYANTLEE